MATIINTPPGNDSGNSATIWVVGLIVIVLIGLFSFFMWDKDANQAPAPVPTTQQPTAQPRPAVNNNTIINATSTNTTNNSTTTR